MYSDLRLISTWPVARHVVVCRGLLRAEFGHQPGACNYQIKFASCDVLDIRSTGIWLPGTGDCIVSLFDFLS